MTKDLNDACSFVRSAVPQVIADFNRRYASRFVAKVGEVLRFTADQQAKYAQGRTTPGRIVTNADGVTTLSSHQAQTFHGETCSHAADIDIFRPDGSYVGSAPGDDHFYLPIIGLGIAHGLQSGGEWMHVDLPHLYCLQSPA